MSTKAAPPGEISLNGSRTRCERASQTRSDHLTTRGRSTSTRPTLHRDSPARECTASPPGRAAGPARPPARAGYGARPTSPPRFGARDAADNAARRPSRFYCLSFVKSKLLCDPSPSDPKIVAAWRDPAARFRRERDAPRRAGRRRRRACCLACHSQFHAGLSLSKIEAIGVIATRNPSSSLERGHSEELPMMPASTHPRRAGSRNTPSARGRARPRVRRRDVRRALLAHRRQARRI